MIEQIVFYGFSILLLLSAMMVVTVRNPVFAALCLIVSFFSSAAIWILLEAEFLAITLVLVYAGAVMVLFMFVVMMLDINLTTLRQGFARYLPVGIGVAVLMAVLMIAAIYSGEPELAKHVAIRHDAQHSNAAALGYALYTLYLYPFEIAGAILLVAIIAAISLTVRKPRSDKAQRPDRQVAVTKADRLKIVKMDATGERPSTQNADGGESPQ